MFLLFVNKTSGVHIFYSHSYQRTLLGYQFATRKIKCCGVFVLANYNIYVYSIFKLLNVSVKCEIIYRIFSMKRQVSTKRWVSWVDS